MRRLWIVTVAFLSCLGAVALHSQAGNTSIKGDYVEARTASVFAGACHYNGEVTTTGRDALMAWNVTAGSWNGVDLKGVHAIAVVSADENLSDLQAARRSELIVDRSATRAQTLAMVDAIKSRYGCARGDCFGELCSHQFQTRRPDLRCQLSGSRDQCRGDAQRSLLSDAKSHLV